MPESIAAGHHDADREGARGHASLSAAIDGRALVGNRTGIGVHTAEIAGRLQLGAAPVVASHETIVDRSGIEQCRFAVQPERWGVVWQQTAFPKMVSAQGCDVIWGPHGTLPLRLPVPAVATIHDLTSLTHPGSHRLKTILSFNLFIGRSVARARKLAAVSRRTAEELMRGFGISAREITIVPNGVDPFFSPARRGEPREPLPAGLAAGRYILFVGTIEPRKGLDDLLFAWQSLPEPRPELVLCGDPGWGSGKVMTETLPGLVKLSFVDRATLRALYRNAIMFVYPSLYEGFGIPPLEAIGCGAAVIATRTGAIDDYLKDAGILVDPGDRQDLARQMRQLLGSSQLRAELQAKGATRAGQWRWERSAAIMEDLLRDAASN